jgi:hypothetical protein
VAVTGDVVQIRIAVYGEDDPVRDERAARGLRDELLSLDDVLDAGFAPSDSVSPAGAKGPAATDTAVLLATVASSTAATVIAFIRAWADRSIHRKVVIGKDGSVEVHGGIGPREVRLVRELRDVEADAPTGANAKPGQSGGGVSG